MAGNTNKISAPAEDGTATPLRIERIMWHRSRPNSAGGRAKADPVETPDAADADVVHRPFEDAPDAEAPETYRGRAVPSLDDIRGTANFYDQVSKARLRRLAVLDQARRQAPHDDEGPDKAADDAAPDPASARIRALFAPRDENLVPAPAIPTRPRDTVSAASPAPAAAAIPAKRRPGRATLAVAMIVIATVIGWLGYHPAASPPFSAPRAVADADATAAPMPQGLGATTFLSSDTPAAVPTATPATDLANAVPVGAGVTPVPPLVSNDTPEADPVVVAPATAGLTSAAPAGDVGLPTVAAANGSGDVATANALSGNDIDQAGVVNLTAEPDAEGFDLASAPPANDAVPGGLPPSRPPVVDMLDPGLAEPGPPPAVVAGPAPVIQPEPGEIAEPAIDPPASAPAPIAARAAPVGIAESDGEPALWAAATDLPTNPGVLTEPGQPGAGGSATDAAASTIVLAALEPTVAPVSPATLVRLATDSAPLIAILPPQPPADPVPAAPKDAARIAVALFVPGSVSDDALSSEYAALLSVGYAVPAAKRVGFAISSDQVRYFHTEDSPAAHALASSIGAMVRDFTTYRPKPAAGTIEIWLAGNGGWVAPHSGSNTFASSRTDTPAAPRPERSAGGGASSGSTQASSGTSGAQPAPAPTPVAKTTAKVTTTAKTVLSPADAAAAAVRNRILKQLGSLTKTP